MHGNPGSSLDFEGILRWVPKDVRVVAVELIGFGSADKPYDFAYDWRASRPVVDQA